MIWRRGLATVASCVILVATASSASAAQKEKPPRCQGGFALLTEDEAVQQPIFLKGIEDGLFTEEQLRMGFAGFDENGNGLACFKPLPGDKFMLPHPFRIRDDH
jgi:hypothetical protein